MADILKKVLGKAFTVQEDNSLRREVTVAILRSKH